MKTLLTTTALAALLAAGPALAQSDTAPATTEPPAATQEMAPDAGMTAEPPAATEEVAPDATAPEVAPDQNLTDTETVAPETDADTMATDEQAETPDVAATDDGEIYVGEQATEEQLATNWIGQSLYNANDENLGDINDLLIDKDGTVKAVIVGVGGFLGIGAKDVALAPNAFQVVPGDKSKNESDKLKLSMSKDELKQAATFEPYKAPAATTGMGGGPGQRPAPAGGGMAR